MSEQQPPPDLADVIAQADAKVKTALEFGLHSALVPVAHLALLVEIARRTLDDGK